MALEHVATELLLLIPSRTVLLCLQMPRPDLIDSTVLGLAPKSVATIRTFLQADKIQAALREAQRVTQRVRKLPLESMVVFVVAMSLFRSHSMEHLALLLGLASSDSGVMGLASSSLVEARDRLGAAPVRGLFYALAEDVVKQQSAHTARWRSLSLWSVDGTSLRVADSKANRREFGGHSGGPRGHSAYPLVRVVALMALSSRQIVQAVFGPFARSEIALAQPIWSQLQDNSLVIVDRNFGSAAILHAIERGGEQRHWLIRLKKNARYTIVRSLGDGDWLVQRCVSPTARKKDPTLPTSYFARVICYQMPGFPAQKLMTSLLSPVNFPSNEIRTLYHLRWDIELGFDEIKTELLDRRESLRSRTPERVRQEIWGLFLAHNYVRSELCVIAKTAKLPPSRISFIAVLRRIRVYLVVMISVNDDNIPIQLQRYLTHLPPLVLRPRRPERHYPRAVKIKMSSYAKKRPASATLARNDIGKIAA